MESLFLDNGRKEVDWISFIALNTLFFYVCFDLPHQTAKLRECICR